MRKQSLLKPMKPKCNYSRNEDHVCLKEQARQCISFKSSRWRRNLFLFTCHRQNCDIVVCFCSKTYILAIGAACRIRNNYWYGAVQAATPVMYRVKLTRKILHYSLPWETIIYSDKSKNTFCFNGNVQQYYCLFVYTNLVTVCWPIWWKCR